MPRNNSWLETETKVVLQRLPPQTIAPATTETYSAVVLSIDIESNHAHQTRAFDRVLCTSLDDAEVQTRRTTPFVVKSGLTIADAMLAQFELACCDIVSVFISDVVLSTADPNYLEDLYRSLLQSGEFVTVSLHVVSIPGNTEGQMFVEQFIGDTIPNFPHKMIMMCKKARIMKYWARKIGVKLMLGANYAAR